MSKKNIQIAYIGGGSRSWARVLMVDLAKENEFKAEVKLYDIDYEAAKENEQIGNDLMARKDGGIVGEHHFTAVKTIGEALTGSDFVFISILPGTFDEMESDVHTPEKYGIYQSVGDTTGPGGIVRAMRTIPMFRDIALAVKKYSPNAWVINYTNPMTICVKTLYEVFPEIKAFGCCHEVFGTQKLLAKAYEEEFGEEIKREDINVNVSGVNHFTFITKAKYKGVDVFEIYKKFVDKYYETGILEGDLNWLNGAFATTNRVKFDLFKRFGAIAAAGDRHLAEFCPGYWYLGNKENVKSWGFGLTPVSVRKEWLVDKIADSKKYLAHEKQIELFDTGEEAIVQIKAILGLGDKVTNVNLPNMGQMAGIRKGAVVETNAAFTSDSVVPVVSDELPLELLTLIQRISNEQEVLVRAILDKDYDRVFKCFINNPLVNIPLEDAKKLFIEMVENTKAYIEGADEYLKNAKL